MSPRLSFSEPSLRLLAIISEGVLWFILLAAGYFLWQMVPAWVLGQNTVKKPQQVVLYFHDANQLMPGAPLNWMGSNIGYVSAVRPSGSLIAVTVRTYPDTMPLPKGAIFTIEFNGLAGAKTVEILPPVLKQPDDPLAFMATQLQPSGYRVQEPIRLRDVTQTQMVLADALVSGAANFDQALGRFQEPAAFMARLQHLDEQLIGMTHAMVYAREALLVQNNTLHTNMTSATTAMEVYTKAAVQLLYATQPSFFRTHTMATFRYLHLATAETYHALTKPYTQSVATVLKRHIWMTRTWTWQTRTQILQGLPSVWTGWSQVNQMLEGMLRFLSRIDRTLQQAPPSERVQRMHVKAHRWQQQSKKLIYRNK
jgi:hypothetical protein